MNPISKNLAATALMLVLLSGCFGGKTSVSSSSAASSPNSSSRAASVSSSEPTAPKIEVMDFSKKLDLKKPAEPINKAPKILFLGNSFLFVNDLPATFALLSQSGGYDIAYEELSDGGYHLSYFADPEDELGAQFYDICANYELDYVILQEQSRLPTLKDDAKQEMYPAARTLDETIKKTGAQTVFLMTWAYKNGDDLTEFGIDSVTTRDEMQTQLAETYTEISGELDALLSPAGIAFVRAADAYPDIALWDAEDNMHPTLAGTYLAACTLYATVYNETPVGLSYIDELDADTAAKLQQVAADTVLGA